jgi:hypothetical protein
MTSMLLSMSALPVLVALRPIIPSATLFASILAGFLIGGVARRNRKEAQD